MAEFDTDAHRADAAARTEAHPPSSEIRRLDVRAVERVFEACFRARWQTILIGGGDEPVYRPSIDPMESPHRIIYREDFFASALHEVAHWCLAGEKRRLLEDYGYWYAPDGRSRADQEAFEKAEVEPQALEWIFSDTCGFEFNLSADNLSGEVGSSARFGEQVASRKRRYLAESLPPRANAFCLALAAAAERHALEVRPIGSR